MNRITRREMLCLLGAGAAGAALAGCVPAGVEAPLEATGAAPGQDGAVEEGEAQPTTAPALAEPVIVTFVESWFGIPQFADTIAPVTEALSAKMQGEGLNIEIRSMLLDDHAAKYPVLYASGADFTCAFDAPWYKMSSLIDQGALLALEPMVSGYGPNITETVTPKIIDFNYMTDASDEDHLYGLPVGYYYGTTAGVILREDLRAKHGTPAPTSAGGFPSLEPYLAAIKENEPDMIPLATKLPWATLVNAQMWHRTAKEYAGSFGGLMIPNVFEDTTIVDTETLEWFQFAAELTRLWYENGYVPQEAIGADYDVVTDYFNAQRTACYPVTEPDFKYPEVGKAIATAVEGAQAHGYDLSGQRAGGKGLGTLKQWNFVVFNAAAPEDQQVAGIRFFDWLMSERENADMWLMGIEGVNWIKEPNMRYSDPEGIDPVRNYRRMWYVSGVTGRMSRLSKDLPEEAEEALNFYITEDNFLYTPLDKFDPSTKDIETELAGMDAVSQEAFFGVSTGSIPTDQALATWTQMLDDAGRQTVKVWYQEKLDSWIAENEDYIDSFGTGYTGQSLATWPRG